MKLRLIIILFVLFWSSIFILRKLPHYCMQNSFMYYQILDIQDFAKDHNKLFFPKIYKKEVESYLEKALPSAKSEMDKIMQEVYELRANFLKNPINEETLYEYSYKLDDCERGLNVAEFEVYSKLFDITDKYLLIPFGGLPTDYSGAIWEVIAPYFLMYEIDNSKLIELGDYLEEKQSELSEISEQTFSYGQ